MALSLTAEQKSISDIFSGKTQYIIPPYQKAYAWEYKQCQLLFDDLKNAYLYDKEEGYFLGNIFIAQNQCDLNRLEVIDGQQRLATLLLLMKALLQFDKGNPDLKNILGIQDAKPPLKSMVFMKKDDFFLNEALSLDLSKKNNESRKADSLHKINIRYFYDKIITLSGTVDIKYFINFIIFNTYLLSISVVGRNPDSARESALKIFLTMNQHR